MLSSPIHIYSSQLPKFPDPKHTKPQKMFSFSSQFDGGVTASQFTQSDPSSTPFSSAKSRDGQPMIPVTVKQISEAVQSPEDKSSFLIGGTQVTNVKLVGMVYDKSVRVTDVSFVLDDGTGRLECTRWVNDTADTDEVEGFSDGVHVRVHGHLKLYQGKKQVVAFAVRPITDYNEIATHFIECAFMHSFNAKLSAQNGTSTTSPASANSGINSNHLNGQSALSTHSVEQYSLDGLKDIEKKIIDYLEQPSSLAQEKGVHRNDIAQHLKLPENKILEAMQSLESEGLVYSTVDEYHYKSTSS